MKKCISCTVDVKKLFILSKNITKTTKIEPKWRKKRQKELFFSQIQQNLMYNGRKWKMHFMSVIHQKILKNEQKLSILSKNWVKNTQIEPKLTKIDQNWCKIDNFLTSMHHEIAFILVKNEPKKTNLSEKTLKLSKNDEKTLNFDQKQPKMVKFDDKKVQFMML